MAVKISTSFRTQPVALLPSRHAASVPFMRPKLAPTTRRKAPLTPVAGVLSAAVSAPQKALSVVDIIPKLLEGDAGKSLPLEWVGLATLMQIGLTFAVSKAVVHVVRAAAQRADVNLEHHIDRQGGVSLQYAAINTALYALQGPVSFFLPLAAVLFTIHKGADFMEDVLVVKGDAFSSLTQGAAEQIAHALNGIDRMAESYSFVFMVALCTWCVIRWKDKIVDVVTYKATHTEGVKKTKSTLSEFEKLLRPISQASTWLIVAGAALTTLNILGIDISPLVTVGGVSGIAIGFGAQSVTASVISGLNLFLTRPFVVGERVQVTNQFGATIVSGVVESINPMRTILTNDQNHSVAMPNSILTQMNIVNQSRLDASKALPVTHLAPLYSAVGIKYKDVDTVQTVAHAITEMLRKNDEVDESLPHSCMLQSIKNGEAAEFSVTAHTLARDTAHMQEVQMHLMLAMSRLVEQSGATVEFVEARDE